MEASSRHTLAPLGRVVVASLAAWLPAVALLLCIRRFSGGFEQPLPSPALLLVGLLLALLAWLMRGLLIGAPGHWLFHNRTSVSIHSPFAIAVQAVALVALLAAGLAFSLPGTPGWSLILFWTLLIAQEAAWHIAMRRRTEISLRQPADRVANSTNATELQNESAQYEEEENLPPDVSQQIIRSENAEGVTVSGLVRIQFAAAEQTRQLHIPFSPPLSTVPQVEAEDADGSGISIRVAEVQPYGVRFNLRRAADDSSPRQVLVQFFAAQGAEAVIGQR